MSGDKCRWFNKNGFALGTGECVLHRRVCGSGHEVCEQYEEYEPRPHGAWIFDNLTGYWYCSNCEREPKDQNNMLPFCAWCGSDNRKRGEANENMR